MFEDLTLGATAQHGARTEGFTLPHGRTADIYAPPDPEARAAGKWEPL